MIAKIKKTTTVKEKKSKKLEKKVTKKQNVAEGKPKVKKERVEPPKKLKGISKRFNVEKPSKAKKIKKEVKVEETEENATEPPATAEKPVKVSGRKAKPYNFGIVQIRSLPHGFYEVELREFFQQFGDVHRVRVARSLKTGRSTGVGYVEFKVPEVAEIAADTMNNYLLMKNILKTTYIPPEKATPRIMQSRVRVRMQDGKELVLSSTNGRRATAIKKHNATPTEKSIQKRGKKLQKKVEAKKRQLSEAGIDFDVESVVKKPKVEVEEPVPTSPKKSGKKAKKEVKEKQKGKASAKPEDTQEAEVSRKAPKVKKVKEKAEKPKKAVKKKKISIKLAPMKPKKVDSPKKDAKKGIKIKVGQKVASKGVKKSKKVV